VALLLIGALFLLVTKIISLRIPLSFIGTLGIITWVFGKQGFFKGDFLFNILSGGIILGAFFMATDYVTSPLTKKGKIIFGIGCGILTTVIRLRGSYPEGVCYSILFMNAAVPIIDRFTKTKKYGQQ
jgi:electron transport complex protein RnfD